MFGTGLLRRSTKVVAYGLTGFVGAGAKTLAVGTRGSRIRDKNLRELQKQTALLQEQGVGTAPTAQLSKEDSADYLDRLLVAPNPVTGAPAPDNLFTRRAAKRIAERERMSR